MNKGVKNDTLDFGSVAAGDEVDKLQRLYQDLIGSLLLGYCILFATISQMASVPYGVFAACKAARKDLESDMKVSRLPKFEDNSKNQFSNKKLMEYSPVKYNGKMMNSIWGLYNRYSPHNIKKSCDADFEFRGAKNQQ